MKNINKYTGSLLAVLLLLLGGCTMENLENSTAMNPSVPEGSGFISLSVNAATTRDAGTTTRGTDWENNINAVRVILYDKPTEGEPTVQYAFHFNITTNPYPDESSYDYFLDGGLYMNGSYIPGNALYIDNRTNEDRFITFAQPVKRQDYQMLVIINPTFRITEEGGSGTVTRGVATRDDTDSPPTVADMEADFYSDLDINIYARTRCGEPLSAMTEYIRPNRTQILGTGGLADRNWPSNFLMTNEQDLIQISADKIPPTRNEAHASPFKVSVDRVVAKIVVGVENEPDNYLSPIPTPEGAVFCNVGYVVDHQNKTTYWLRNMAWLRNGYESKMEKRGDGSDRGDRYAFTPNFNGLVELGSKYADYHTYNYDFYNPLELYPPFMYSGSLKEEDFEWLGVIDGNDRCKYVLENTVSPERYAAGERFYTRVLIRGNYVPEGIEVTGGVIPSYYTYNEMVITQDQMNIYKRQVYDIAVELDAFNSDGAMMLPLDSFPYGPHAEEPESMPGLFRTLFLITYDGLLFEQYPSRNDYLDGTIAFDAADGYGLAAYRDGVSYFSVPIKHFGDTGGGKEGDYGYYGVVRNNIYTVIINSISGPGAPTPAGSSSHISAGIKITPWGRVGREINIGEEKPVFACVRYEYYMDGNTTDVVKTDYDYSLPVGDAIPTNQAVLNRYKTYVNSLGQGTFGDGRLVSGSASKVAPGTNVVKVMYYPITGMEQSRPPVIGRIVKDPRENTDPFGILGEGVPGATVTLTIRGKSYQIPVDGGGIWGILMSQTDIEPGDLVLGEIVSATQTEPGKLESERVDAIVEPTT